MRLLRLCGSLFLQTTLLMLVVNASVGDQLHMNFCSRHVDKHDPDVHACVHVE